MIIKDPTAPQLHQSIAITLLVKVNVRKLAIIWKKCLV